MSNRIRLNRTLLGFALGAGFLPVLALADYRETRNLAVDAEELTDLEIRAGAGSLEVRGVDGLERIEVEAEIIVRHIRDSKGPEYVAEAVTLELRARDRHARLTANRDRGTLRNDRPTVINLVVRVPARLALDIDDESGHLEVAHIRGGVRLDDDSGDARLSDIAGGVNARDDSGDLTVEDVEGAVEISDDSGSLRIRGIRGPVDIRDDSGDIVVEHIVGDVYIDDDSGGIRVERVGGTVTIDDDSGDIVVLDVSGDLEILDDGSGDLRIDQIRGIVRVDS